MSVVKNVDVKNVNNMAKMRLFKFWNEAGDEKETEQISLKKAIMSVQSNFKDKMISVEYISKKGKEMCHRRREALKAKNASRK